VLDEMVEADQVLPVATEWARFYAGRAQFAAQMIKRSVNAISSALDRSIMHMDFDQNILAQSTEDAAEAVAAYRERREPRFTGR
jgi:1,4-dihydroxy-2-naphthoyl-CoA synthase